MTLKAIYPGLVASELIWYDEDAKYSFRVWLWQEQADLVRWANRYALIPKSDPGYYSDAMGLCHRVEIGLLYDEPGQHLGELHFVFNEWTLAHVAHECCHALMHFLRTQNESFSRVLYHVYRNWPDWEEEICYPFGILVDQIYSWLSKKNPGPR